MVGSESFICGYHHRIPNGPPNHKNISPKPHGVHGVNTSCCPPVGCLVVAAETALLSGCAEIKNGYIRINLLSAILFRIANPVQPFGFKVIHGYPLLTLFREILDGLGQPTKLFEQLIDGLVNVFEKIHSYFLAPAVRRLNWR